MSGSTMTNGLVSTWVSTVDSLGRTHLETRWVDGRAPAPAPALLATPVARPAASRAGRAGHAA